MDDPRQLLTRIAELEQALRERTAEVRRLRLQMDVLAGTDAATGLANRNGILDLIDLALARLERNREPFAVAAMGFPGLEDRGDDIDVGDIQHVSALLTAGLRRLDRMARIDVGVFAGVLPGLTAEHVAVVEQRMRTILGVGADDEPDPRFAVVLIDVDAGAKVLDPGLLLDRAERVQAELRPGATSVVRA
jgi:PleD family two-component response regulator